MRNILFLLLIAISLTVVADSPGVIIDQARLDRLGAATMPNIDEPISFDTEQADAILSALEIFPPDNPWNIPIDTWPVAENSAAMIEAIGAGKPLRGNTDMAFVLVPPNRHRMDRFTSIDLRPQFQSTEARWMDKLRCRRASDFPSDRTLR